MWIQKMAETTASWLVKRGANPDDQEILAYGAEGLFSELLINAVTFLFAFIYGKPMLMLVWLLLFLPLRINIGGGHATTPGKCIVISIAMSILFLILNNYAVLATWWFLVFEGVFCVIVVFCFAPVVHPNHPVSPRRYKNSKRIGRLLVLIYCFVIAGLFQLGYSSYAQAAAFGMTAAAILCLIGVFSNKKKQIHTMPHTGA